MKEIKLLSRGIFEKNFMDSHVHTRTMTTKEKVLGHLIGPLGMIMLVNVIGALSELYYTEQVPIDTIYGTGTYMAISVSRQVLGILMGLANGWLVQHTRSRQGRIRPWSLIGGLIACATATLMFTIPRGSGDTMWLVTTWAAILLHHVLGVMLYNLGTNNYVAICTRDMQERTNAYFFRKLALTLISGILIGLILMSILYYRFLINNRDAWWKLILALSILGIPFIFMEYFWTRERVTDEAKARSEEEYHGQNYPLKDQLKALFTDKYYLLVLLCITITGCLESMKGGNVSTNYCRWVLGATAENNFQMIYTIASGVPTGIGAIIAWPLAKKLGVRKFSILGFILAGLAGIAGLLNPAMPIWSIAAGFVKNIGLIPYAYVTASLFSSALDNVEYRTGMRLDGMLGVAIIGMIQGLIYSPFAGLYETILLGKGFDATLSVQSDGVRNWVSFCFWGLDIIIALVYIIVLLLYTLEKKIPEINAALLERRKQAALANGEEWVDPEELAKREQEEIAKEHEENRIADLKARCEKKGLDFDAENTKYLEKQRIKAEKQRIKEEKKKKNE